MFKHDVNNEKSKFIDIPVIHIKMFKDNSVMESFKD